MFKTTLENLFYVKHECQSEQCGEVFLVPMYVNDGEAFYMLDDPAFRDGSLRCPKCGISTVNDEPPKICDEDLDEEGLVKEAESASSQ